MDLVPRIENPYFIYAPAYTHTSAGVKALHLLCHALNRFGEKAYIYPMANDGGWTNPLMNTPMLSDNEIRFYAANDVKPIVIYPEIVKGDPIGIGKSVRYLLAPAGAYGGDKEFSADDMVWSYTRSIAAEQSSGRVLLIPTVDRSIFYRGDEVRSGSCYYAYKYDRIHGNTLLPVTDGSVRLEGSPKQIADTLRRSQKCYAYEVSEAILCAQLCGCPVELVRTPYFRDVPENWDFPVMENASEEWQEKFDGAYTELEKNFPRQLIKFIQETQEWIKL